MKRALYAILLISMFLAVSACTTPTRKSEGYMADDISGMEVNYQFLSDRIDGIEARLEAIEDKVAEANSMAVVCPPDAQEMKSLDARVTSLEIRLFGQSTFPGGDAGAEEGETAPLLEIQPLKEEGVQKTVPYKTYEKPEVTDEKTSMPVNTVETTKAIEIKVLYGTDSAALAKVAAEKLQEMGYKVSQIDLSQKRFEKTTVFHTPGLISHAVKIANAMNGILKPLTWESRFGIIVVVAE